MKDAYKEYVGLSFNELLTNAKLLPIEKAIILFVQATKPENTEEQIASYQENIKQLLPSETDKIRYTQIYAIYALTDNVYIDKVMRTEAKRLYKQELNIEQLNAVIVQKGTELHERLQQKQKEIFEFENDIDKNRIDDTTWNRAFPRDYKWPLNSFLNSFKHMIQNKQFTPPQ